jgi:small subunit ribosomal protein S20
MPIIASAKKKLRADARKKKINQKVRASVKLSLKTAREKLTQDNLQKAYSALDKAAKKGIIPKKRADRRKSRLAKFLVKSAPTKAKKAASGKNKTTK